MTAGTTNRSDVDTLTGEIRHLFDCAALLPTRWADAVTVDAWQPTWRIELCGRQALEDFYRGAYPHGQEVIAARGFASEHGAVVELATRSRDAERRFAKLCVVVETDRDGLITELRIHCTGEWPGSTERQFIGQGRSLTI